LVTNSLTGIILQPGAWGSGPGNLDSIYIHDIRIRDMQTALTYELKKQKSKRSNLMSFKKFILQAKNFY
jgi:hypothetical protein